MFNLLPENLKAMIKKEYKFRKIVVILIFIICLQISFLVFIFPSWLVSLYNEKEVISQSEEANKKLSTLDTAPVTDTIKGLNSKLGILNTSLEYPKIIPFIDLVISKKTSSITISGFHYTFSADGSTFITVDGISTTRESLVAFSNALQDSGVFKELNLPISNLAKDKDISFSIDLKIPKK